MKCAGILRFFDMLNAPKKPGAKNTIQPQSIFDYISQKPKATGWTGVVDPFETYKICKKFELEGLMIHAGKGRGGPALGEHFYSNIKFSNELAQYGGYEYIIYGFNKIREDFKNSVFPLIAVKGDKEDIGSSFLFSENIIVTARHCIDGQDKFKLVIEGLNHSFIDKVEFHKNDNIDLALIHLDRAYSDTLSSKRFLLGQYNVLDEILVMGYPPIPGFENVLISETAQIGNVMNASHGEIVTSQKSYLAKVELIVFNARAKGGNSGGPILNKLGTVVGVVTDMPTNQGTEFFGYGAATPHFYISEMLAGQTVEVNIHKENDYILIK